MLFVTDWTHPTVDSIYEEVQNVGVVQLQNGLINGTSVFGYDSWSNQTGTRFNTSMQAGKSCRIRLINNAIDSHFKFMIDNHTLTVMSHDFVPITPYQTQIVNIAMGK
jgi:hypothetical protein